MKKEMATSHDEVILLEYRDDKISTMHVADAPMGPMKIEEMSLWMKWLTQLFQESKRCKQLWSLIIC